MNINRRDFVRVAGLGMASAQAATAEAGHAAQTTSRNRAANSRRKVAMKVGTQHDSSDEVLGILAALGVNCICSRLPSATLDAEWSAEGLTRPPHPRARGSGGDARRRGARTSRW